MCDKTVRDFLDRKITLISFISCFRVSWNVQYINECNHILFSTDHFLATESYWEWCFQGEFAWKGTEINACQRICVEKF